MLLINCDPALYFYTAVKTRTSDAAEIREERLLARGGCGGLLWLKVFSQKNLVS